MPTSPRWYASLRRDADGNHDLGAPPHRLPPFERLYLRGYISEVISPRLYDLGAPREGGERETHRLILIILIILISGAPREGGERQTHRLIFSLDWLGLLIPAIFGRCPPSEKCPPS